MRQSAAEGAGGGRRTKSILAYVQTQEAGILSGTEAFLSDKNQISKSVSRNSLMMLSELGGGGDEGCDEGVWLGVWGVVKGVGLRGVMFGREAYKGVIVKKLSSNTRKVEDPDMD